MNSNPQPHSKKASFFKTLPENIAQSPTGIIKISNSPFPSLDPTKQFRSVYERAGFDVYKPSKSRQGSRVTSPTVTEHGFRSQSTSKLQQPTAPQIFDGKRNYSEQNNVGNHKYNYGDQIPRFNKAPLTIDANLANVSQRDGIQTQLSTGSTTTSTFDNPRPKPLHSATSSTFTDADVRSGSGQSSYRTNNGSSTNQFVSAQSLPYSHDRRSSRSSGRTYNNAHSSPRNRGTASERSSLNSIPRVSPLKRSFEPAIHNHPSEDPRETTQPHEFEQPSFQQSNDGDRSVDTVKYTPARKLDSSFPAAQLPGAFPNEFYDEVNPLSNSTELDVNSDEEQEVSDDESFKSEILSPKNQHFDFVSPTKDVDDSLEDSTRNISLDLPAAPPSQIPQLTTNDSEENLLNPANDFSSQPPNDFGKFHDMRQSTVSIAASSIYSNDYRQSTTPFSNFSEFDRIDENEEEDIRAVSGSSGPVYEEIEHQLQELSLNSKQTAEPPKILIHSVKEVSTDSPSEPEESHAYEMQRTGSNEAASIKTDVSATPSEHFEDKEIIPNTTLQQQQQQEQQIPKYPPGEGPCRKCGLEIEKKPIYSKSGELSGQWHRECFTCTLCDLKFNKNTSCFVLKDLPYCEYHYHLTNNSLCKVCGKGIVGKCLENDANDRYHADCLKCTKCGTFIVSDYLSINGRVHCESCATEFTGSRATDPNDVIERRRTKLYFI